MKTTVISLLVVGVVIASLVTVGSVFSGDGGNPDYFLLYRSNAVEEDFFPIKLSDRFIGSAKDFQVRRLIKLGAPAEVTRSPGGTGPAPEHADAHLALYKIRGNRKIDPRVTLNLTNLLNNDIEVKVRQLGHLLVPALKDDQAIDSGDLDTFLGNLGSDELNHYTCYRVTLLDEFDEIEDEVGVSDQFGGHALEEVNHPRMLCVPAIKEHPATEFSPRSNEMVYLLCYQVEGEGDDEKRDLFVGDQFASQALVVDTEGPILLCVPSTEV